MQHFVQVSFEGPPTTLSQGIYLCQSAGISLECSLNQASHVLSKVIYPILGQAVDCPVSLGSGRSWDFSSWIQMRSLVTVSVRTVINSRDLAQYVLGGMARKARGHLRVSGAPRGPGRYLGNTSSLLFWLTRGHLTKSRASQGQKNKWVKAQEHKGPSPMQEMAKAHRKHRESRYKSRRSHQWRDAASGWGQRQTQPRTKHCEVHCMF